MTTWLRLVGASIMGILDPIPSTVPSPMTDEEGAWVRANAWTKGLRKIEDAYPHGFHRWCSCERGICHPCGSRHHDQCVSADGPRVDGDAGTITDRHGFVVAVIRYSPGQQPCRWICPCTHTPTDEADKTDDVDISEARPAASSPAPREATSGTPFAPDGQLSLFAEPDQPEESANGRTP